MKKSFILFCFLFFVNNANAVNLDSLLAVLKTAKNDTNKVKNLYNLSNAYNGNKVRKYNKAIELSFEILKLSEKINYKKGIYYYHDLIGYSYYKNNETEKAISYFEKSIIYFNSLNYKKDVARAYGNMGNCYYRLNIYPKALENYISALKIFEGLNRKVEVAGYSGNIGAIYNSISNNEKALEYYDKALKINEELKNERGISINLVCIGNSYVDLKKFTLAEQYYQKALTINEKIDDKEYYANNLLNIGNVNSHLKNEPEALAYFKKAHFIFAEINELYGVSKALYHIGSSYRLLEKNDEALKNLSEALEMGEKQKSILVQKDCYKELYQLYYSLKDYKSSFDLYKKYILFKDSVNNESIQKEVLRKQLYFDFEKKEALTKIEFEKEQSRKQLEIEKRKQAIVQLEKENVLKQLNLTQSNLQLKEKEVENETQKKQVELLNKDKLIQESLNAQKNNELEQQKKLRNIFVFGAIVLFCFAIYILFNLSKSKKTNKLIEKQKMEVETQKHLVEEKQKEIVDSINYAQRIQYALLANKKLLDDNLNSKFKIQNSKEKTERVETLDANLVDEPLEANDNYFIFFKPKDVVSGDFYWASKLNNGTFLLATADSTGHGVPGAIMSILNISCLNESVNSDRLLLPSEILNATRQKIINHLMNDGSSEGGKDGMDCSLICIDFKQLKMQYAAANNPIWIHRDNSIIHLKADKMPVGKHDKDTIPFANNIFDLNKGDIIYTFTDGFADQFGGEKGKKFKYKQLEELLLTISSNTMSNQHDMLLNSFNQWKGDLEQVDDVCVIGVRI